MLRVVMTEVADWLSYVADEQMPNALSVPVEAWASPKSFSSGRDEKNAVSMGSKGVVEGQMQLLNE